MRCGTGWPKSDGKVLFWIVVAFFLLLLLFELTDCVFYNPEITKIEPRPETYHYRIEPYVNNLMLPAAEHWEYVTEQISGTGYVKTREQWAERVWGSYLFCVWVYYEKT